MSLHAVPPDLPEPLSRSPPLPRNSERSPERGRLGRRLATQKTPPEAAPLAHPVSS